VQGKSLIYGISLKHECAITRNHDKKKEIKMPREKAADLSASLVAVKGKASASPDAAARQPEVPVASASYSSPLNFKVDPDFRRRFRLRAAEADLKLNELLRQALDAWEEKNLGNV
jgi:hypothetical protein